METLNVKTFKIDAKVRKPIYRIGDTAVFDAKVMRPADEDPAGMGLPTDGIDKRPAEEANIGVGLLVGDVFLPGFSVTNDQGKAVIKIRIEKYVKPGPVDAAFYAWKTQADTPCLRLEESGFFAKQNAFTIKR